jgi:hypothetical protein
MERKEDKETVNMNVRGAPLRGGTVTENQKTGQIHISFPS